MRSLFNTIQKIKEDWGFEVPGEVPELMDTDAPFHDEDCFESDDSKNESRPTLERKGALCRADSSKSELKPQSAATERLRGLGFDVSMTPEQEAELHAVIKQITDLELAQETPSLPQVSE